MATNTTGLGIEREGDDSLNATGCIEDLEGGLYHVAVYDIEADGTIDWHNSALSLTAALNWTSPDKPNTGKCYHRSNRSIMLPTHTVLTCTTVLMQATVCMLFAERSISSYYKSSSCMLGTSLSSSFFSQIHHSC